MKNFDKNSNSESLKAVIFDWAGTTVDYGCFAPTGVFKEVFRQKGIEITDLEARGPMGMYKRDHIKVISKYPRVKEEWISKHGQECAEDDIEEMFRNFIPLQMSVIDQHSLIVPELPEALKVVRAMGLKIGSTTGYTAEMMKILTESAAKQGYIPDEMVCASDVSAGRPAPWMALRNAELLGIYPMQTIVKIGDTVADIEEGVNAGMWSVGVINSSNEMGLSLSDISLMVPAELESRQKQIREKFKNAGADFVIESLAEIEGLFAIINSEIANGLKPGFV
jgi:phosphonoacetaldehyde hydrolase